MKRYPAPELLGLLTYQSRSRHIGINQRLRRVINSVTALAVRKQSGFVFGELTLLRFTTTPVCCHSPKKKCRVYHTQPVNAYGCSVPRLTRFTIPNLYGTRHNTHYEKVWGIIKPISGDFKGNVIFFNKNSFFFIEKSAIESIIKIIA